MSGFERSAAERAAEIQGDSVRATWAQEDDARLERKPLRRDPPPQHADIPATDNPLHLHLAEELDYARRTLAALGDELSADAPVVVRHGQALQSIDIVGQTLGHLACVIRSSDPKRAIERIGMAELKARLSRKRID